MKLKRRIKSPFISCFLLIIIFITTLPTSSTTQLKYQAQPHPNPLSDWTFIAYLVGDNNLEQDMMKFLNDMETIGSTPQVSILALIDDYDIWNKQTRCYYVQQDSDPFHINSIILGDSSEKNMGDPQTLIDFVSFAHNNYPAHHYCLVIADHCMGWIRMCTDETSNDSLNSTELKHAATHIKTVLNKNIDIMLLDACLGTMLELLYQTQDTISISISTEGFMMKHYINFADILQELITTPTMTPYNYTKKIVDLSTQTVAFNNTDIKTLAQAVDQFASVLLENMPPKRTMQKALRHSWLPVTTKTPCYIHDLYNFAFTIATENSTTTLKQRSAAQTLIALIKNSTIKKTSYGTDSLLCTMKNGLGISLPSSNDSFPVNEYTNLDFAHDTSWDEFIRAFVENTISSQLLLHQSTCNHLSRIHQTTWNNNHQNLITIKTSLYQKIIGDNHVCLCKKS